MNIILAVLLLFMTGWGIMPKSSPEQKQELQLDGYTSYDRKQLPAYPKQPPYNRQDLIKKLSKLDEVYDRLALEPLTVYSKDDGVFMRVRKLYQPREELNLEDEEQLRQSVYEALGQSFPLYLETFVLPEQPNVAGVIAKIDQQTKRILVVEYLPFDVLDPIMQEANWLSFSKDAIVKFENEERPVSFDDFREGQRVEVWASASKAISYPALTRAYELNILDG
ncbi:hypothetical protein GCM10023310_28390 [Paenibacillus vulneris]|uniref:DUF3221 domain-containing protein n=2 Tax=Paenibacillus TaxID=44249 RepID=A0ABW3UQG0_9BACL